MYMYIQIYTYTSVRLIISMQLHSIVFYASLVWYNLQDFSDSGVLAALFSMPRIDSGDKLASDPGFRVRPAKMSPF